MREDITAANTEQTAILASPAETPINTRALQPIKPLRPLRVLHFVTGGFSGATQVAVDLCLATQGEAPPQHLPVQSLLVLRRKKGTTRQRLQALRAQGVQVQVVSNWLHARTVWELRRIIRAWQPDALFAHGFSDHIWGRQAAVAEGVHHIFHVEHSARERYTPRRLRQALALAAYTRASIGVSEGVRASLVARGFAPQQCIAIPNGIALERWPNSLLPANWQARAPTIIMAARFARQKDHASLLHALHLLRARGLTPTLHLAGSGSRWRTLHLQYLVRRLGLRQQVHFLGNVADMPQRLVASRIFVLSTRWEGMPLALVEAMAAGCACIGSDVVGVREIIHPESTGLLVPPSDAPALADALQRLLTDAPFAEQLGRAARERALSTHGRALMWKRYCALLAPQP